MSHKFVLLNPFAKAGNAYKLWQQLASQLPHSIEDQLVLTTEDWESQLRQALANGTQCFIAAGGDGTVNELINKIIQNKNSVDLASLSLGAVGLGSSNDFHKPYTNKISDIPIKISQDKYRQRDILQADYLDANEVPGKRYFIVSSSIGFVAEANAFFNSKTRFISFLKRQHTPSAILYTALRTLFKFNALDLELSADPINESLKILNLNLLKSNYISGSFHVDLPISVNNGKFTLAITHYMNRLKTIITLFKLTKGRFTQNPYCNWHSLDKLEVSAKKSFALELDGEVLLVNKVKFSVFSESIKECL